MCATILPLLASVLPAFFIVGSFADDAVVAGKGWSMSGRPIEVMEIDPAYAVISDSGSDSSSAPLRNRVRENNSDHRVLATTSSILYRGGPVMTGTTVSYNSRCYICMLTIFKWLYLLFLSMTAASLCNLVWRVDL